ncbi:MAG: ribonuclease D [Thioalkalivibrio sp.]|nr:ribonuclease D [Thioalkalivibrio sp.]
MHNHGLIASPQALKDFLDAIGGTEWIALDTEFMREKTYYPRLGLVQLATLDRLACVDPQGLDIRELEPLLLDPNVTKVLHSATQDLEVLYRELGRVPAPLFDTQIAAGLLGYGDQIGYANLVKAILDRDLDKSQTRTDWSQRPLSEQQIRYATDDVRFLATLFMRLLRDLETRQRMEWLRPEMEKLTDPSLYEPDPELAWQRVSGVNRLKPHQRGILKTIAAWRERQAQAQDRPRRWILGDDILLDIARRVPRERGELQRLRGFPGNMKGTLQEELLEAIRTGQAMPREEWPQLPEKAKLTEAEEVLVDVGMALLRECARRNDITPSFVGQRRDIIDLLQGNGSRGRLASGWRNKVAGQTIARWFAGHGGLTCSERSLQIDS